MENICPLYTRILNNGGQFLNDGSIYRDIVSKDGSKIIRQIAQKNGTVAIDVYNRSNGQLISCYRKQARGDKGSFASKFFNYTKGKGQIHNVLKAGKKGSFMQTLFKAGNTGKIRSTGDFFSKADDQIKKCEVTYLPFNQGQVNSNNLRLYTQVFNRDFGPQDSSIF